MSKTSPIVMNHQKRRLDNFWCVHGSQLLCLAKYYSRWWYKTLVKPAQIFQKSFLPLLQHGCVQRQTLSDGFTDIIHYANHYFSITDCNLLELWSKLMIIGKKQTKLEGTLSNHNLFMCAVFKCHSGAFFSHINIIKSKTRNRLSQYSLNAELCICMFSMPLTKFSQTYVENCVIYW